MGGSDAYLEPDGRTDKQDLQWGQTILSPVQVMISHLKQQVADGKVDTEQLAALRVTNTSLEQQVRKLSDDLSEARSAHTPV